MGEQKSQMDMDEATNIIKTVIGESNTSLLTKCTRLGKAEKDKAPPLLLSFRETSHKENFMDNLKNLKGTQYQRISVVHDLTKKQREKLQELRNEAREKQSQDSGGLDIQGGRSPINVDCEKNEKENTPPSTKPGIQTNNRGSDSRECKGQGPSTGGHRKELTGETGQIVHTSVNNVNTPNAVNRCENYLSNECNDVNTSESNLSNECNDVKSSSFNLFDDNERTNRNPPPPPPAASSAVGILMPTH